MGLLPQPYEGPPLKRRAGVLRWSVPKSIRLFEKKYEREDYQVKDFEDRSDK